MDEGLLRSLIGSVIGISCDAAEKIMTIYEGGFTVEKKADQSPLTEADLAANNTIVEGLSALSPKLPIISEEAVNLPFDERLGWADYWLVDPLDGTREFVKRNGEFTVNIALISDHRPVLGVVYVPVTGVCYSAARGLGAWKQTGVGGDAVKIESRPWNGGRLTLAGSRSHGDKLTQEFVERFEDVKIIPMGSSLKSCLVAEGLADVYTRFGPTSEWDTAAAQCVVEEAGGQLTGMNRAPLRYNTKGSLLNPYFMVVGDGSVAWQDYIPSDAQGC